MLYPEKTVQLKDGSSVLFRSPRQEDAAEMLDYLKATAAETEFVLRYPEECTLTIAQEETFLANVVRSEHECMIVCEAKGKIAGNCHLTLYSRQKVCHRASLAIALRQAYWGQGIGSAMIAEVIAVARSRGIAQLELEYIEGNDRGRRLYEKMGFRAVAEKPNAYRLRDGSFRREISMILPL